ncbi:MAG: hypothetical protein ACP5OE_09590 [Thermodesulfobium sp.]
MDIEELRKIEDKDVVVEFKNGRRVTGFLMIGKGTEFSIGRWVFRDPANIKEIKILPKNKGVAKYDK